MESMKATATSSSQQIKAAIFVRVSTHKQNSDRQISDLRRLADRNGWQIVEVVSEQISGATQNSGRAGVQRLLQLAAAGSIDKVLITEISRLGRKVSEVTTLIDQLTNYKISVYVENLGFETLNAGGAKNSMFMPVLTVMASFAEAERETLRERILSGMKEAAAKGRKAGRPAGSTGEALAAKYPKVVRLLKDGHSIRNAAAIAGISPATVQKLAKELKQASKAERAPKAEQATAA
jgi:DNA invertase Pin-like site-specific DNA recombinase